MTDIAINFTDGTAAPAFEPLAAVPDPAPGPQVPDPAPVVYPAQRQVPMFEGSAVGMAEVKISGSAIIDGEFTVSLDDVVRAVGEYRVTKVMHYAHPKTGETVRQQVLTPVAPLEVVPWDSSNPNDDGISRARP